MEGRIFCYIFGVSNRSMRKHPLWAERCFSPHFLVVLAILNRTTGENPRDTLMPSKNPVATKMFFVTGKGTHKHQLVSFEAALRDAGIAHFNLVYVSSIYPPGCKIISAADGLKGLKAGQIVHCVMARIDTNEPSRRITSALGLAIPAEPNQYGYISEHHAYGISEEDGEEYAEDLAATMLATTLGIPFDAEKDYNARKEQYAMGGEIVDTTSITMAVTAEPGGVWTTVICAAVLI
jgi:arginine decarboxylase